MGRLFKRTFDRFRTLISTVSKGDFVREDSQAQILIEGEITNPDTLERLSEAQSAATDKGVTQTLSNGRADINSPLTVMQSIAADDEQFARQFEAADTDDDGVLDQNVEALYDSLSETAPEEAQSVRYRNGDSDEAARMVVAIEGGADGTAITNQMGSVADGLDGSGLEATATGSAILNEIVQDELVNTVIQSLSITLVATFVFLMITYRIIEGSATLGVVTLLPVAFSVMWILGTMYLLDIPFKALRGMITSLTVGLGVAYSIHLSERYKQELERSGEVWTAMNRAVTGTGGALLGSAATTVGGFGVLVFAILPPLQQFGVPTDAQDSQPLRFEGEVLAGTERFPVEGDATLEVVADVFERITAAGTVSESDLRTAYDRYEEGVVTRQRCRLSSPARGGARSDRGRSQSPRASACS